jgi:hypothetical protein
MPPDTGNSKHNLYTGNNEIDMQSTSDSVPSHHLFDWRLVLGVSLVLSGIMFLIEQTLHTGFLLIVAPVVSGIVLVGAGLRDKQAGYLVGGSIVFGLGLGFLMSWLGLAGHSPLRSLGMGLFGISLGFALITILIWLVLKKRIWWPLIPAGIIGCTAVVFSFTSAGIFDFVFYLVGGLGVILLTVGIYKKMLGLIIPGSLLIGIGPGIALAWGEIGGIRALAQTGVMLVWFALGWAMITFVSRIVFQKFIWWPLIPGGILAMVGWGLYIGGNPTNAVNFIGNTGSIAMIFFGLYLLLMRRGIRS